MTPTDEFVEAMRELRRCVADSAHYAAGEASRQAVEAFADATEGQHRHKVPPAQWEQLRTDLRTALLKRVMGGDDE